MGLSGFGLGLTVVGGVGDAASGKNNQTWQSS